MDITEPKPFISQTITPSPSLEDQKPKQLTGRIVVPDEIIREVVQAFEAGLQGAYKKMEQKAVVIPSGEFQKMEQIQLRVFKGVGDVQQDFELEKDVPSEGAPAIKEEGVHFSPAEYEDTVGMMENNERADLTQVYIRK